MKFLGSINNDNDIVNKEYTVDPEIYDSYPGLAPTMYIVNAGSGYSVKDTLSVTFDNDNIIFDFVVLEVDNNGGITKLGAFYNDEDVAIYMSKYNYTNKMPDTTINLDNESSDGTGASIRMYFGTLSNTHYGLYGIRDMAIPLVINGGSGYAKNDLLYIDGITTSSSIFYSFVFKVYSVDSNGTIKSVRPYKASYLNPISRSRENNISTYNTTGNGTGAELLIHSLRINLAQKINEIKKETADLNNYKAPIDSPAFTGTPTALTPAAGDNSTKIATTEFVQQEINKSIIRAGVPRQSTNIPTSWQETQMPINTVYNSIGNNFELNNNEIVAKKDMYVLITLLFNFLHNNAINSEFDYYITINGSPNFTCYNKSATGLETVTIPNYLLYLNKGDKIGWGIISGVTGNFEILFAQLNVQEI